MLTQEYIKTLLEYSQETGEFTWKVRRGGNANAGTVAGTKHANGYIEIKIGDQSFRAHRLAFLYVNGDWPKDEVDHINHIRNDNRWINLRQATTSENRSNVPIRKDNKSGYKGVHWHKGYMSWVASIRKNGKRHQIGRYKNIDDAAAAYMEASKNMHGEFSALKEKK
jgi:hypothetical protein